MLPEEIMPYEKVINRIKTALTKENQDSHKETTFKNNDESDSAAIGFTYILKRLEEK